MKLKNQKPVSLPTAPISSPEPASPIRVAEQKPKENQAPAPLQAVLPGSAIEKARREGTLLHAPIASILRTKLYWSIFDLLPGDFGLPSKIESMRPKDVPAPASWSCYAVEHGVRLDSYDKDGERYLMFFSGSVGIGVSQKMRRAFATFAAPELQEQMLGYLDRLDAMRAELSKFAKERGFLTPEQFQRFDTLSIDAQRYYKGIRKESRNLLIQEISIVELGMILFARRDNQNPDVLFPYDKERGPVARFLACQEGRYAGEAIMKWSRWSKNLGLDLDNEARKRRFEHVLWFLEEAIFWFSKTVKKPADWDFKNDPNPKRKHVDMISVHEGIFYRTDETIRVSNLDGEHRTGVWHIWALRPEYTRQFHATTKADTHAYASFFSVPPEIFGLNKRSFATALCLYHRLPFGGDGNVSSLKSLGNHIRTAHQSDAVTRESVAMSLEACAKHLGLVVKLGDLELDDQLVMPAFCPPPEPVEDEADATDATDAPDTPGVESGEDESGDEVSSSTRRHKPHRRRRVAHARRSTSQLVLGSVARQWLKQNFARWDRMVVLA